MALPQFTAGQNQNHTARLTLLLLVACYGAPLLAAAPNAILCDETGEVTVDFPFIELITKTVSLNIETRRELREQELSKALQRENDRRIALNLEPVESLDDIEDEDVPDVQLEQAAKIVTDLATIREVSTPPAKTAQISP